MKFLFALQCANAGGTERVALEHMKQLMVLGHECRVVSLEPIAGLGPLLEEAGIEAVGLDYRRLLGIPAYLKLRRLFAEYKPDALLQFGHRLVTTMAAVGARIPFKTYYILHHHRGMKSNAAWQLNYRLALCGFPHLLFLTEHTRREAVQLVASVEHRSGVLYAPIQLHARTTPQMRASARARLGLPSEAWLMGNAGRQVPIKRFDVFLETAACIARVKPDAQFVLGGAGPENPSLRALAVQLGLEDRVIWLDWLADMDDFYRSLDVVCFNTDIDALGMVPLEALARGIPVVCSVPEGGLSEILPWSDRYVFDVHDAERLAAGAVRLKGSEAEAQIITGRERIAGNCDPVRVTSQLLDSLSF